MHTGRFYCFWGTSTRSNCDGSSCILIGFSVHNRTKGAAIRKTMRTIELKSTDRNLRSLWDHFTSGKETDPVKVVVEGQPALAVLPWELFESMRETLEIYQDEEMMRAIRRGEEDVESGNTLNWDEALSHLGW